MKARLIALAAVLLFARTCSAHRLDEYLQATILSVEKDHLHASMRLIPGMAVSSSVIASIDGDENGVFSQSEQQAYAHRVLDDLSVAVDGKNLRPRLMSWEFPEPGQMREGTGEIHLLFEVDLPRGGVDRQIILENHHLNHGSVYLVNATVPDDPTLHIVAQRRNEQQSVYELDYQQLDSQKFGSQQAGVSRASAGSWGSVTEGFAALFRLGMRHIAEGTDHLLFLLTLLLPAPLIVLGPRWGGAVGVTASLVRVLKIVTAFTIGHSLTLALAAMGLLRVPSPPVEVLIAVSILVSAIHALRPIFPGKEAGIAAFFGLIHGLAFASTLSNLGLGFWQRASGIVAFNLGIETMQMMVVALALPWLLLLSRGRAYVYLRVGGACLAGLASMAWIVERLQG